MRKLTQRDWELFFYKRICPVLYRKKGGITNQLGFIEHLNKKIKDKRSITIVLSGPSSKDIKPNQNTFFISVNNSYRLVPKYESMLYLLYDPFFVNRYLKANNFIVNQSVVILFPVTRFEKIRLWNEKLFQRIKNIFESTHNLNTEHLLYEQYENTLNDLQELESFFYNVLDWDGEVYNSGVLAVMLGSYFCVQNGIALDIYGLDMGIGGRTHIDTSKSVMHPKFLSERNISGVSQLLKAIYNLPIEVNNHSYFQPE